MRIASIIASTVAVLTLTLTALAWVPKADIKAERRGAAKFAIVGTNSIGKVDVSIEDKHLFQGFSGEGKNGDNKVEFTIKSAGIAGGWNIEGKNGDIRFDLKATQKGVMSKEWSVKGKVGEKTVDETISGNWDVDPAIEASVVAFDL